MNASNYLETAVLNHFFRAQTITSPIKLYLALYINDPTDSDTGTEVSGLGYHRQQITFNEPVQMSGSAVIASASKIEYPIAGADWGNISHWAILDAQESGNMLIFGGFDRVQNLLESNRFTIEAGNIKVALD